MARARVPAPATLMAALLAAAMAATAAGAADNSTKVCDKVKCGKGICSEVPGLIPLLTASYKCTCDPGWSQQRFTAGPLLDWLPCVIPNCSFSNACLNRTMPTPPKGIPLLDACDVVDCGQGGDCEKGAGAGFSYQCRCQPGFKNLLDDTSMPCIRGSCTFGPDCAKLGLVNTPDAPAPAPVVGNDLY